MTFENPFKAGFWLAFGCCFGLFAFSVVGYLFWALGMGIILAG